MPTALRSPLVVALLWVLLLGAMFASTKIVFLGTTVSGDYLEYVATAQSIAGDPDGRIVPHRFLKPLAPAVIAGLATMVDYKTAVLAQALFFYFALVVAMFLLTHEFFNDRFRAVLVTSLLTLSYPVLKYGVELNIETGAWFFYVLSLWLTVKFLKSPVRLIFLANAAVITIGFLWKEYSIVSAIIFGLTLIIHPQLALTQKIRYIAAYAALFLTIHIPLQIYVYMQYGYTYLSWYMSNAPAGVAAGEFTLRTITKSTAALLGLAWLLVPLGFMRFALFATWQKRFFQTALLPPFIGYVWGYISSRLLYVMAPPFLLVAGMGLAGWSRRTQVAIVVAIIVANIAWLFLSYKITL